MEERLSELESEGFWSDSIKEIVLEFEVPHRTAVSWERNIGGIEVLKEAFGRNDSDNYLELIRQREWIPHERENREEEWVQPLKRWCTKRAEGVYLVHESELEDFRDQHGPTGMQYMRFDSGWMAVALMDDAQTRREDTGIRGSNWTEEMAALREELEQKEEWVKYEMRRIDSEWIGLTRELREVEKKLIEIYQDHLDDNDKEFEYKKDEIIELKRSFPYLRANADLVVSATNSSYSYVNKFKYIPNEGVAERGVKGKLRDEVLERDGNACVSCGSEDSLQVHHIIPRNQGGENVKDNLATLCVDCHYYAHGGGALSDDGSYTVALWDSVEYDDQVAFWDEWIHQSFEERAPKGFTRANFELKE